MKLKRWMNLLAFVVTLTVNALANILPLNGQNTGDISDSYPVLFTPRRVCIFDLGPDLSFAGCFFRFTSFCPGSATQNL